MFRSFRLIALVCYLSWFGTSEAQGFTDENTFAHHNQLNSEQILSSKPWANILEKRLVGNSFIWVIKPGYQDSISEFAQRVAEIDEDAEIVWIPALEERLNQLGGYRFIPYSGLYNDSKHNLSEPTTWFDAYTREGTLVISAEWIDHFKLNTLTATTLLTQFERQIQARRGEYPMLQAIFSPDSKVASLDLDGEPFIDAISLENNFFWVGVFRHLLLNRLWNEDGVMAGEKRLSPEKLKESIPILKNLLTHGLKISTIIESIFDRWQILQGQNTKLNDINLLVRKNEDSNHVLWCTFFEAKKFTYQPQYVMRVPIGKSENFKSEQDIDQQLVDRLSVIKDAVAKYKKYYQDKIMELSEFESPNSKPEAYLDWLSNSLDPQLFR